jgi:hypothetical protein
MSAPSKKKAKGYAPAEFVPPPSLFKQRESPLVVGSRANKGARQASLISMFGGGNEHEELEPMAGDVEDEDEDEEVERDRRSPESGVREEELKLKRSSVAIASSEEEEEEQEEGTPCVCFLFVFFCFALIIL